MTLKITTINGETFTADNITQLTLLETAGVPCNSLSARFFDKRAVDEIVGVKLYDGDKLIFNGSCDKQTVSFDDDGFEIYIYARSSASVLVDNEALPSTFYNPTAKQLYFNYIEKFGIKNGLPDIACDDKYEVSKGTSCYGALNIFFSLIKGSDIYVTPDNTLKLLEESDDIKRLNDYNILSAFAIINRSEPLSQISFKRDSSENYRVHTTANISNTIGINRQRYLNLTSLPVWQRSYKAVSTLKDAYKTYKQLEITVSGYIPDELYSRFNYSGEIGDYDDYILAEKKYTLGKNGCQTKLVLQKAIDIKEITYVA
ncbi:MAG: hypothetical protein LIO62_03445 [Clostridiales bacterium]|nr:hypothetical protein [Clostridiales bacterium]